MILAQQAAAVARQALPAQRIDAWLKDRQLTSRIRAAAADFDGDTAVLCPAPSQAGDTKAETRDSKTADGESKTDAGNSKADVGDPKADAQASKVDAGNSKADAVKCKTAAGDSKADFRNSKADAALNSVSGVADIKSQSPSNSLSEGGYESALAESEGESEVADNSTASITQNKKVSNLCKQIFFGSMLDTLSDVYLSKEMSIP